VLGEGSASVVLANQSDRDLCSWLPLSRALERAGLRVLLFDYGADEPQNEVAAAAQALREAGADRVALLGASKGARAVLVAGSTLRPQPSSVISLSAEATGSSGPLLIRPYVKRLQVPMLFIAAREDSYTVTAGKRTSCTAPPGRRRSACSSCRGQRTGSTS
jgi:dienelactone hydrolase